MKQISLVIGLAFVLLTFVVACESREPYGESKKAEQGHEAGEAGGAETAISAPASSPGRMENDEGVDHYSQGHWDVAEVHFRKSLDVDPGLAEAHFNLALALDKLGRHGDATKHFKKAAELAPKNPKIAQSKILRAHIGM